MRDIYGGMTILRSLTGSFFLVMAFSVPAAAEAQAAPAGDSSAEAATQYLANHPGGRLVGDDEVAYPDGSGFVAVPAGTLSLSQCSSGEFCMWTSASYTGSFTYVTGDGVTRTLSGTVKSFWNDRSPAAALYNDAGPSSTCYSAGTMKSSLSTSYQSPAKVYLSAGSSC